jgi:iron complex outermembrane receptor protein
VEQLAGFAPTVTFSQNTGFAQLTIRGIGTNVVFAGSDPSSAVYVDGVYLARPAAVLGDFLELERVEVLRGPQGTLYGRNTVGGALNVITKRPTNEVEASARVIAGNVKTLRSEARVSGPLVRDKVLGSVAFLRGVRNGFVRDLDHPGHPLGGEDVTATQGKLNVVFNPRTDLLIAADLSHQDPIPLVYAKVLAVKPGFEVDNPADPHEVRTSVAAESRKLQYGGSGRLTMQLSPRTRLTSLTAYRSLDYELVVDGDITELELTVSNVHEIHHQWSQELTISSERPGLRWLAGAFLFDEVDRQPTRVRLGGPGLLNYLDPRVDARAEAAFAQATIDIGRHFSATSGLRMTHERKTIDNTGELTRLDPPHAVVPGSCYTYTDELEHTAWSPKFGLQLRPSANTQAYISATRGFKSGGFNLTSAQAGRGYAPEWVWSYEGGVKTAAANGRMRFNVAAFLADYSDLQVQTAISPGVIDISNAAEARIRGVELEGIARLTPTLNAGGHLAWLDAVYERYIAVGVGGITGDVAGRRLTNAPLWSGRQWLEWSHDLGRSGRMSLRADARWQSTVFFTPFNDEVQRQRPYGLLDLSMELLPASGRWSILAYARNITDEDYITGAFSSPPPAIGGRPGDSRQFGVQVSAGR